MNEVELKTVNITSKGQITIPAKARKRVLKDSKTALIVTTPNEIRIRRPLSEDEAWLRLNMEAASDWFSKEEDEAWKDL